MSFHDEDFQTNPSELFAPSVIGEKKISSSSSHSSHSSFYGRDKLEEQLFPREFESEQNKFQILDPSQGFSSFGASEDFGDGFPERQNGQGALGRDYMEDLSFQANNLSLSGGSSKSQQFSSILPHQQQFDDGSNYPPPQRQGQMASPNVFHGMNEQSGMIGGQQNFNQYGHQQQHHQQQLNGPQGGGMGGRGMGGYQDNYGLPHGGNMMGGGGAGRGGFGGGGNYSQDPYNNQQYQQNNVSPRFPGRHASHHDMSPISGGVQQAGGLGQGGPGGAHIFGAPETAGGGGGGFSGGRGGGFGPHVGMGGQSSFGVNAHNGSERGGGGYDTRNQGGYNGFGSSGGGGGGGGMHLNHQFGGAGAGGSGSHGPHHGNQGGFGSGNGMQGSSNGGLGWNYDRGQGHFDEYLQPTCVYVVAFKTTCKDYILGARLPIDSVNAGDAVIVSVERGEDLGVVSHTLTMEEFMMERFQSPVIPHQFNINRYVGTIIRLATPREVRMLKMKAADEEEVLEYARHLVDNTYHIKMSVFNAEYQFDRQKIIIYYDSKTKVNYQQFVKDIHSFAKARVWMERVIQP